MGEWGIVFFYKKYICFFIYAGERANLPRPAVGLCRLRVMRNGPKQVSGLD